MGGVAAWQAEHLGRGCARAPVTWAGAAGLRVSDLKVPGSPE